MVAPPAVAAMAFPGAPEQPTAPAAPGSLALAGKLAELEGTVAVQGAAIAMLLARVAELEKSREVLEPPPAA